MSFLLIVAAKEADKLDERNWCVFCGTPCNNVTWTHPFKKKKIGSEIVRIILKVIGYFFFIYD
jgi:hypothetical protein